MTDMDTYPSAKRLLLRGPRHRLVPRAARSGLGFTRWTITALALWTLFAPPTAIAQEGRDPGGGGVFSRLCDGTIPTRAGQCDDGNICTLDHCHCEGDSCACVNIPRNSGSCTRDDDPCTRDVCVRGVCTHPPRDEGDLCGVDGLLGRCCGGVCCHGHCCNGDCCDPGDRCCNNECCTPGSCCEGNTICCEGSCCNDECCEGPCCDGTCCPANFESCCNDQCCEGPCCVGIGCCPESDESCCNNQCCEGPCCNDICCAAGETCCNGICCAAGQTCCEGACCDVGQCCDDGDPCTDDACVDGACQHTLLSRCDDCSGGCSDGNPCTDDNCLGGVCMHFCSPACSCGSNCCSAAGTCCNAATGFCCSTGTTCCLGLDCCNAAEECCDNGECCEQPCEGCQDNGSLSGGSIVANPNPACVGDTIIFTVSGVVDDGGIKRVDCTAKMEIPPVEPTYTWTITKPDGTPLNGSGPVATVVPDQPGTYSCTFTATAARECPPNPITIGPSTVEVATVATLAWEEFVPESTPLDTCPNNDGARLFPGKRYAVDPSWNIRDKVTLVAAVTPIVEGCTVYFRSWDVDDPFDQRFNCPGPTPDGRPCVTDAHLIDGDTSGPDNRLPGAGGDTGVGQWSAVTDANGQARVTVTVSMQPGNNYRGGASTIQSAMNATTQAQADSNTPPQDVVFSTMLTIWRKVWVELDSMGPGSDITYTGVIDAITNNSPHTGDGTVELDVPEIDDNGRFEGGTMTVPATGNTYTIIDNVDVAFGDDDYTMSTLITAGDYAETATVVDDDTAVLPKTPDADLTVLDAKYRNCYIEFNENAATRDNNNTFVGTLPWDNDALRDAGLENADLSPGADFWVAIVLTCYQSHHDTSGDNATTADGDPDRRYHIHGGTWTAGDSQLILGGTPANTANVSTFYYETALDFIAQVSSGYWAGIVSQPLGFLEPRVIAHEIGHQFGLPDVGPAAGTLMSPWDGTDQEFDASELAVVRDSRDLESN